MRLPMTSSGPAPRASGWPAWGCSNVEIGPCSEVDTGPVASGCPPGRPKGRTYCGSAGLLQSAITIDCAWRHLRGAATLRLPGKYAMPVLHSHHILWVLRRPRMAPTSVGLLTLVTSQTSYPEALLP